MSVGRPSCSTISYTRARSARELRSNTRPRADQFRCSGNCTRAKASATSSRGRRSGTQTGLPRELSRWVNVTCGLVVSSQPASERSREKVATVGDFRPRSYADRVVRDVPARRASSSCVKPASARARSSSSKGSTLPTLMYSIGYNSFLRNAREARAVPHPVTARGLLRVPAWPSDGCVTPPRLTV